MMYYILITYLFILIAEVPHIKYIEAIVLVASVH